MAKRLTAASDFEKDLIERLKNPEFAVAYLNEMIQDRSQGARERLLLAFRRMAQTYGMGRLAKKIQRGRETLYTTLSKQGNPTLDTYLSLLEAFGIQQNFTLKRTSKTSRTKSA